MNHYHGINLYVYIFSGLYAIRLIYICLLIQFNLLGGREKDTAKDRFGLVLAMNALIMYHLLQIIGCIVVLVAYGKEGFVIEQIVTITISFCVALWWRESAKMFWLEAHNTEKIFGK